MIDAVNYAKPDRRRDILDAATRLFGAHGYGNTTTDEIAEAANVTKRTMYRYARSKEQILLLIHERFLDAVDELSATWTRESAPSSLRRFVEAYVTIVIDNQHAVRVFYEEIKNLSAENRAAVVERRDSFERTLRDLLAAGISDEQFRAIDVPVAAAGILGGLADIYRWYSPDGKASSNEIAKTASDLFLHGLTNAVPTHGAAGSAERLAEVMVELKGFETTARRPPESVMTAARDLFIEHGYLATSTREIAARAGITKSALFYHIRSKEELLFALQDDFGHRSLAIAVDNLGAISAPADVIEALRRFMIAHCRIIDAEPEAVELFTDQFRYLEGEHRERIVAMRDLYSAALRCTVEFGRGTGVVRSVDTKVSTLVIIGMLNSLYRWYKRAGRLSADEVGETFADVILEGLVPRP